MKRNGRMLSFDDVHKFIARKLGRYPKEVWLAPVMGEKPFLTNGRTPGGVFIGTYTSAIEPDDLLEDVHEAQTAAAVLGHNFPDSPWYKNAYTLLREGGLEPSENRESWISKQFRKVVG